MQVKYEGHILTQFKGTDAGKSRATVEGLYQNEKGEQFVVKKPEDKCELFAELFASLLIKEFIARKLIDEDYAASLLVADVLPFGDGSYGLIQPMINYTELHKLIGTTNPQRNDRDPAIELFFGSSYYKTLIEQQQHFGLSMALMVSLLLGAYSVHSANIVAMENANNEGIQFGRTNWRDAFRYYGHPDNTNDILYAYANRGLGNLNKYYKDYILYYAAIPGIYPAIASKALALNSSLKPEMLEDIVLSALQGVPENLLDVQAKKQFATYIDIPAFERVQFGMSAISHNEFVTKMAEIMHKRLIKLMQLHDLTVTNSEETRYKSTYVPTATFLLLIPNVSFPVLLENWNNTVFNSKPGSVIDTRTVDLKELVTVFNKYIESLAYQSEQMNVWQHESQNTNIFLPYAAGKKGESEHGHAFIAQYKEATVFRHLFALDPATIGTRRFAPFEKPNEAYVKANPNSPWTAMRTLATAGLDVIQTVKLIQKLNPKQDGEIYLMNMETLRKKLIEFMLHKNVVEKMLGAVEQVQATNSCFYDIGDAELAALTGDQLLTICLEELNIEQSSPLVDRIVANDMIWQRMESSMNTDVFIGRKDNFKEKIEKLRALRKTIVDNSVAKDETNSDAKGVSPAQKQQFWFFGEKDKVAEGDKIAPEASVKKK